MSSLKNAQKKFQRVHRERSQPGERRHLGYLEKKKDYKARAEDYQSKTKRLKELRKQALDKNPDEFYFHMINSQLKDGRHYEKNNVSEFTEDQLKIIQSRDLRYIEYKRSCEMAKIEKLKSTLHLIHVDEKPQNKRLVFTDDGKPKKVKAKTSKLVSDEDLSLGDPGWKERKKAYRELQKREDRLKQLTILSQKMSLKQHLNKTKGQKPQKVADGDPETPPVYKWPKERQR